MKRNDGKQMNPDAAVQRGYLVEDYRVFHINSVEKEAIPPHFHGFHKLILVEQGELSYVIEGVSCKAEPGQVLLVPAFTIHQPLIGSSPYERIVVWISPEAPEMKDLEEVFLLAQEEHTFIVSEEKTVRCMRELADVDSSRFGAERLRSALLVQVLVQSGRELKKHSLEQDLEERRKKAKAENRNSDRSAGRSGSRNRKQQRSGGIVQDGQVQALIRFINEHLTEDLSTGRLAESFYCSESGLSGKFRRATGCSVHRFVLQKRLIRAARLIRGGMAAVRAAEEAGFSDYSSFYRAFVQNFEMSPKEFSETKNRGIMN